jgi:DNA-directed RNA polymerase subunit RPC12/RpoP
MKFERPVSEAAHRQASRSRRFRFYAVGICLAFGAGNVWFVPRNFYGNATRFVAIGWLALTFLCLQVLRALRCPRCDQHYFRKTPRSAANLAAVECEHCRFRI